MQTPQRKPGKYTNQKPDPYLTEAKFQELKDKLERLKKFSQPKAREEVKRLAEMGDFSENAAYQIAKGRLRGMNQAILDIADHLKRAVIITRNSQADRVVLGSMVTVEIDKKIKNFQILGSSETNPMSGIISHNSPIGSALLGARMGETVKISLPTGQKTFIILKIE